MGLRYAVVTAVARDDLRRRRRRRRSPPPSRRSARARPGAQVEVLIPDCKGDADALDAIFAARPDVLNHNIETVARLQRAARPSAGYARSLAVLARAKAAGLTTKSGLIVGHGRDRRRGASAPSPTSRGVGVDIVTIGQYLRPTVAPPAGGPLVDARASSTRCKAAGEALGIAHVEAEPAHPLELPRPPGRRRGRGAGSGAVAVALGRPRPGRLRIGGPSRRATADWPDGNRARLHRRRPGRLDRGPARVLRRPPRRAAPDGHVNLSPKGYDTLRVLDPRHGRLPRPHRQRRRDHRPPPRERPHHPHVLRVRGAAADRAALRHAATSCCPATPTGTTCGAGSPPARAPGRSSAPGSSGCRRRAASPCRS